MDVKLSELPERVARAVRERREPVRLVDGDKCLGVVVPTDLSAPPDLSALYARLPVLPSAAELLRAERDAG